MRYEKEITRQEIFDVVVVGGGVAGFTAAVAAARTGAHTALIEDSGALGGILTTGLNPQIGIFYAYKKQVIAGIGWELCKRLEKQGFAEIPNFEKIDTSLGGIPSNVKVVPAMAEAEMLAMCKESGVSLFFHTKAVDATVKKEKVTALIAADKNGLRCFTASVFIDCSGDGDFAVFCGAEYEKSKTLQPGTYGYSFHTTNLDELTEETLRTAFTTAREKGELCHGDFWPEYHAPIKNFFIEGGDNANHIAFDGSDADDLTRAEIEGRDRMARMMKFASSQANIVIHPSAANVSARETRRITCDYKMSVADFLTGRLYEDSICYGYYNMDLHSDKKGQAFDSENQTLPPCVIPAIPYRSLTVKGFINLLVAGRCAGFDRRVMGALRVKAPCMAMGEAVGTAAALSLPQGNVKTVDMQMLKQRLTNNGAIVPKKDFI
ncbi:MAG: FAD-dependent oxidoreductase [Clostridiales bacterium]|nr:FAD-dependent oxidoreductase [Clostridiales bacterium]